MHEHFAIAMYYCSIQLLYASMVGAAAWVLTSIRSASATTKYWIWVVTEINFILPLGALVDKFLTPRLWWGTPLGAVGVWIWAITHGWMAGVLAGIWMVGALAMLVRLMSRIRRELHEAHRRDSLAGSDVARRFAADGIPVIFDERHPVPSVHGLLYPHILLPIGIDHLLSHREFNAVLLHELVHARRRDNLIRLLYELSLCVLWFHPLIWLAGARIALYRELSCDESVIQRAHGRELASALAKLASPEPALFLQATASSHLGQRLARLAGTPQPATCSASLLLTCLFAAAVVAGAFQIVVHTACCFALTR